jgi:hypothetical protein
MYGMVQQGKPVTFGGFTRVGSQKELDYLIKEWEMLRRSRGREFFVQLVGGVVSKKRISLDSAGRYVVHHDIDDTQEVLSASELRSSSIWRAMVCGALFTADVHASRVQH